MADQNDLLDTTTLRAAVSVEKRVTEFIRLAATNATVYQNIFDKFNLYGK